jgi:hypothetical protein
LKPVVNKLVTARSCKNIAIQLAGQLGDGTHNFPEIQAVPGAFEYRTDAGHLPESGRAKRILSSERL